MSICSFVYLMYMHGRIRDVSCLIIFLYNFFYFSLNMYCSILELRVSVMNILDNILYMIATKLKHPSHNSVMKFHRREDRNVYWLCPFTSHLLFGGGNCVVSCHALFCPQPSRYGINSFLYVQKSNLNKNLKLRL